MKIYFVFILIIFIFNGYVQSEQYSVRMPLIGKKMNQYEEKPNKKVVYNEKEKSFSINMKGDIVQILTSINVGGVNQEVIVDTGSVLLVVPSTLCNTCQQPLPHYHPSTKIEYMGCESNECKEMGNACIEFKSSGAKVCGNQVRYLQNTEIVTILVQDSFSFTNDTGHDVLATFGSIVSNRGRSLEHGILGLGKTCDGCRKSPVELIFKKTGISRIFSMWLDNNYQGTMILGDIDQQYSKLIKYTPMLTIEESHYGVLLSSAKIYDKISKNGFVLTSKDFGEVIIDSGTSEALIDASAYYKIKSFLQKDCRPGLCGSNSLLEGYCYNYPDRYFNIFPTIQIEMLGGASIDVEPSSYITSSYVNGIRYRCFGIKPSPLKGKSIIGLSWLRNNYIVFDTEHNRMGFAKRPEETSHTNNNTSDDSFDINEFENEQETQNETDDNDSIEYSSSYQDSQESKELKPSFAEKRKKKYVVKVSDDDLMIQDLQSQLDDYNNQLINEKLSIKQTKHVLNSRKKLLKHINQLKLKRQQDQEIKDQNDEFEKDLKLNQVLKDFEKYEQENNQQVIIEQEEDINNIKEEIVPKISNNEKQQQQQSDTISTKTSKKQKKQNKNKKQQQSSQKNNNKIQFDEPKQRKLREWFKNKNGIISKYSTMKNNEDLLLLNSIQNIDHFNQSNKFEIFKNQDNCILIENNDNNKNKDITIKNNETILLSKSNNRSQSNDTSKLHPIVLKYDPETKRKNIQFKSNKKNLKFKQPKSQIQPNQHQEQELQKPSTLYQNKTNMVLNSFDSKQSSSIKNNLKKSFNLNDNICNFDFTQKKDFEWIDNNGKSYTFWESTIVNNSPNKINEFVLSTMDNVQYIIGMNSNIDHSTTIISLPSNQTISPYSSYRWIYISNSKDSLSFSLGKCSLQNNKK